MRNPLNGRTTGILVAVCIALVSWNLKETVELKAQVRALTVMQERALAFEERVSKLEMAVAEHEGKSAAVIEEFRRFKAEQTH